MTFIDSNQRNSRKQVSNGYDDTSTGDEQIRPVVFLSSRRLWKETNARNPGLEQEDGSERRRTEDEEDTLGMTQKVSISHNRPGAREQGVLRVLQHPLFFSVGNCKLLCIKNKI